MSELICIAFKDLDTADHVLNELRAMEKEYILDLEDAAIVVRDQDSKVHVKQSVDLIGKGAAQGGAFGALWGTLIGWLFLNPVVGFLVGTATGAGAGALTGALSDYGIDDNFIKSLGSTISPGSSAIFLLVRKANEDKVLPRLGKYEGTILKSSLTNEDEKRLWAALAGQKDT